MAVQAIQVGEEVILRGVKDKPTAVVTMNTADHFCTITKGGFVYNCSRAAANPLKTGRRFDVASFLKSLQ